MARLEYKYLVPFDKLELLLADMLQHLNYDYYTELREKKRYTVRSIYLDSPSLTSYYEKLSGVKVRNKFRIRGYNELNHESNVFFEIKRKENDYINKDRAPVQYIDLKYFLENNSLSKVVNHSVNYERRLNSARNFLFYFLKNRLKPVVNVIYERIAMECKYGSGLRITFDLDIRSYLTDEYDNLFEELQPQKIFTDKFVLEVKYNKVLPVWVPKIINKYGLKREAVSKYALSIDSYIKRNINVQSI